MRGGGAPTLPGPGRNGAGAAAQRRSVLASAVGALLALAAPPRPTPPPASPPLTGCRAGVNLNRDFPDPINSPSMDASRGEQPETRAVMDWVLSRQWVASANMHEVRGAAARHAAMAVLCWAVKQRGGGSVEPGASCRRAGAAMFAKQGRWRWTTRGRQLVACACCPLAPTTCEPDAPVAARPGLHRPTRARPTPLPARRPPIYAGRLCGELSF